MSNLCKHKPELHHKVVNYPRETYCDACKHYVLHQNGKYYILLDNDDDEDVESDDNDFADIATGITLIGGLLGGLLGGSSSDDDESDDEDFGGGDSGGGGSSSDWDDE